MTAYTFADPPPFKHQRQALRKVIETKGVCALLMDPGTGKTRVVVDYLSMLALKHGSVDVLVTAPLSALDTWPDQLQQWTPEGVRFAVIEPKGTVPEKAEQVKVLAGTPAEGIRLVVLSHDTFAQRQLVKGTKTVTAQDRLIAAIRRWKPDVLVVDECHRLKGHTSNRSRSHARIAKRIPKRLGLTGTVAPRNPLDIFGQWQTINVETFGDHWESFKATYAKWGGFHDKQPVRWLNQDAMRRLIAKDSIVVKKEDALDLPPWQDVPLIARLSDREAQVYEDMDEAAIAELPSGQEAMSPLALTKFLRLRQITGGFVGFENERGQKVEEEFGRSKARVTADKVYDLVQARRKVVIFAHFRHDLTVLEEEVGKLKIKALVCRVDGSTKPADRLARRLAFRDHDGPAVFIAQMRTMSLAVNELVVASEAIFYSLSERRDDYEQARDRLNRIGQTSHMTFYHVIVPGTIDEVMLRSHRERTELEANILQYARERRAAR